MIFVNGSAASALVIASVALSTVAPCTTAGRAVHARALFQLMGAPSQYHKGNEKRRQNRPHIRTGVENAGGRRTLALRKPFGHGFHGRGKVTRFAHAQAESPQSKLKRRARERRARSRNRPHGQGDRRNPRVPTVSINRPITTNPIAYASVKAALISPYCQSAQPTPLANRLPNPQHRTVNIIHRGGIKQQPANHPAKTRRLLRRRRCGIGVQGRIGLNLRHAKLRGIITACVK